MSSVSWMNLTNKTEQKKQVTEKYMWYNHSNPGKQIIYCTDIILSMKLFFKSKEMINTKYRVMVID